MDSKRPAVATAREALVAELLGDIEHLVQRLENVDQHLAQQIEEATRDAAGKALLVARLNFQTLIDSESDRLTEAGRQAAALMARQLAAGSLDATGAAAALGSTVRRHLALLVLLATLAGAAGGAAALALALCWLL